MAKHSAVHGIVGTIASAAVATALFAGTVQVALHNEQVIILNDEIKAAPVREVMNELLAVPFYKRATLVIESPGGRVDQLSMMRAVLESRGVEYDTEIVGMAASAAADIFMTGQHRKMHKEASILFHETRVYVPIGLFEAEILTTTDLVSFLKTGDLAVNSQAKDKERLKSMLAIQPREMLENLADRMVAMDNSQVELLVKQTGLSKETVLNKLMIANVDVTLTAAQALELKVATEVI